MALKFSIPESSRLAVIGGIFKAVLNSPDIGRYNFTTYMPSGSRYNVAMDMGLQLNPSYLYFFHQMNFSLSIDEGVFLRSIAPNTVPTLSIKDSTTDRNLFHSPFRMFRYFENAAVDSYFISLNKNAVMIGDFQCVLGQIAELVGTSDIFAQCSFSVYEISDDRYIDEFKRAIRHS